MSDTWPPKLKEWVARCLGQMTDANRDDASAEMKQVIAQAFETKTLWTTDWAGVQLQTLLPKALPTPYASPPLGNKRKNEALPPISKKAKKALAKSASTPLEYVDQSALNRRAQRFQREHEIERNKSMVTFPPNRGAPSLLDRASSSTYSSSAYDDTELASVVDLEQSTIVGTSKQMFKDYLRLTSDPNPAQIRPLHILRETLDALKTKWRELSSQSDNQYNWVCSQFKSLRQDLVVQRIKNEFTVTVYEIHARIALQVGDDVEYDKCLAQLLPLYELGLKGQEMEFRAYRLLQLIRGLDRSQLNLYVSRLTSAQKADEMIAHAVAVQRAVSSGNYRAFFRLYLDAPKMSGYIMDHFRDRERVKALIVMTRSYMKLPVSFLSQELAFEGSLENEDLMDKEGQAASDFVEFLTKHKVTAFTNSHARDQDKILDCKSCQDTFSKVFENQYRTVRLKGRI